MTRRTCDLDPSILRAYDIRGVVGQSLRIDDAVAIGRAFATIARARLGRQPRLCVGYDGRLSSPELEKAMVSGSLLNTSPRPRDATLARMPSSA